MKLNGMCRVLGSAILAFGAGILLSFFLPDSFLIVIEAAIIILLGVLCCIRN